MHKFLTRINEVLVQNYWYEQIDEMNNFSIYVASDNFDPTLENTFGQYGYKLPHVTSSKRTKFSKLNKDLENNYISNGTEKDQELLQNFKFLFSLRNSYIYVVTNSNGIEDSVTFENALSSYHMKRKIPFSYYFLEEPNWKMFRDIFIEEIYSIAKTIKEKHKGHSFEFFDQYIKNKVDLIDRVFKERTPINLKTKVNHKYLLGLPSYNFLSPLTNLLNWKLFLSEIKAETNIEEIKVEKRKSKMKDAFKNYLDNYNYIIFSISEIKNDFSNFIILHCKSKSFRYFNFKSFISQKTKYEIENSVTCFGLVPAYLKLKFLCGVKLKR